MRTFITDPDRLAEALARLRPSRRHDGGSTPTLTDPASGATWLLTYLLSERQGGGYRCLVRLPAPSAADLLRLAGDSETPDEIWAAAVLLYEHPELYPDLLALVERAAARADWDRVRLVAGHSGLMSGSNRGFQVGQSVDQIARDAAYYADLGKRATALVQRADAALGPDCRPLAERIKRPWAAV